MKADYKLLVMCNKAPSWDAYIYRDQYPEASKMTADYPEGTRFSVPNDTFSGCCGSYWYLNSFNGNSDFGISIYLGDDGKGNSDEGNKQRAVMQTKNGPITVLILTKWK